MKSLLKLATVKAVTEKKELLTLPRTVQVQLNRTKSLINFNNRYIKLAKEPIPEECTVFDVNGSLDVRRTLANAEKRIHPISRFAYYVYTGLVDELQEAWIKCHGFGQDALMRCKNPMIRYFAKFCDSGDAGDENDVEDLYLRATLLELEGVALYFYRTCSKRQRTLFLMYRTAKILRRRSHADWEHECQMLRLMLSTKDFKIDKFFVEYVVGTNNNLFRGSFFDLPKDCQMPEFAEYLMKLCVRFAE
ncbi:hypothetical protein QR680_010677 [Steinernema hermaphroditum]|uniref:Uncharacterized protein n=1 Tax=Steinernema hermaphroditum TaxID=289476 RepID=A0AA39MC67_9BILA|nr:hypothetical protein QR680_010677 [Steinernema hermaphroditum]